MTTAPDTTDEDTVVVPSASHRDVYPRRGWAGVRPYTPDPERLAGADRLLEAAGDAVERSLTHPQSDPELVAARLEVYTRLRDDLKRCSRTTITVSSVQSYRQAVMGLVTQVIASGAYGSMIDTLFGAIMRWLLTLA